MANILFVCTAFAPKNIIGSIRPSKLAKYMIRMGHEVTVIMPTLNEGEAKDTLLMSAEMDSVRRITVPYGGAYYQIKGIYKSGGSGKSGTSRIGTSSGIKRFAWYFFSLLTEASWTRHVKHWLKENPPEKPYDAVISSYPNIGTHWAARYILRRGWAKRWIADFRDPLVYDWLKGPELMINRFLQSRVVSSCSLVTVVSRGMMSKFVKDGNEDKIIWIPNGFDPDDLHFEDETKAPAEADPSFKSKLVFSYTGGLYGGTRDMRVLFQAFRELIDQKAMPPEGFVFEYAGRDCAVLFSQAKESRMESCVRDHGFLTRQEAMQLQLASDCSLVCTHNSKSDRGVMPGKFYESLLIGKPLLVIVNGDAPESEIKEMSLEMKAGLVYEEANHIRDYEALKAGIANFYQKKTSAGKLLSTLDEKRRDQFSYAHLAQSFMDVISPAQADEKTGSA